MATTRSNPGSPMRPPSWQAAAKVRAPWYWRAIWTVFPPPRRPVRPIDALPLVIFLAAYFLLVVLLHALDVVQFIAPRSFWLMAVAPWFWWMHAAGYSGLRGGRAQVAFISRMLLLGLIVAMIAEPRTVQNNKRLSVIFAVDVSPSISRDLRDEALRFVAHAAATKPAEDHVALVVFSREAAVELPPAMSFPYEDPSDANNAQVNKDGTNIEKALSLASALIKEDTQGRIVLITDGVNTEGSLATAIEDLRSRDIAVDVLPVDYEYDNEVWLERLQLPKLVKSGETYEASVILSAESAGKGKLVLQENEQPIFEGEVEFKPGKNRFNIPIPQREPGFYEYTATIDMPEGEDGVAENNRAISYLYLQGKGKVLIVTDPDGNPLDWQPMVEALQQGEREVEQMTSFQLPRDALGLLPYDCIVFANVGMDKFDKFQLDAVAHAVRNQGSGFLMVGGENSFGPGGYHKTVIEDILPVTMDITQRKVMPKAALAIVLHTCEFPEGNTWAKQVTKQAIRVLSQFDEAGVLAYTFQGQDQWVVPLTPVSNYEDIAIKITNAEIGDMPAYGPTMQMALTGLKASDASTKHMIIISDGDGSPPSPQLLQQFLDERITITTVSVFPHEIDAMSAPPGLTLDENHTMVRIARITQGKHYLLYAAGDEQRLPSIFIKEAKTLRRSMIQEKKFIPAMTYPSQILKGIDALPQLGGYVITSMKGAPAANVLTVPDTEDHDPVLARWNIGVGKSAAFTSDLSPRWGGQWLSWEQYEAFVQQLIVDISRVQQLGNLRIDTYAAGSQGVVTVEDHAEDARFLELIAVVHGPGNRQLPLELKQVGPRRYEARFPTWGVGRYQVTAGTESDAALAERGPTDPDEPIVFAERVHGGFALPYSQEFMRFRADPIVIEQILEQGQGRRLSPTMDGTQIYEVDRTVRQSTASLAEVWWVWLILALLVLHDVGIRRVQMDWALVASWFSSRSRDRNEETMGALLRRKQSVTTRIRQRDDDAPPPPRAARTTADEQPGGIDLTTAPPPPPTADKPGAKSAAVEDESTSTTERLLRLKRKNRQE